MNLLFTILGGLGLWFLFGFINENPQSITIVAFAMLLTMTVGIFGFRLLFDLVFPDHPPLRDVSSDEDE